MADASHLDTAVYCPACLGEVRVRKSYAPDLKVSCPRCTKKFRLNESIVEGDTHPFDGDGAADQAVWGASGGYVVTSIFAVIIGVGYWWAWQLGRGMDGPTFLMVYAGIAIGVAFGQWILRLTWQDKLYISFLAAALMVSISAGRYFGGIQVGMSRFGLLIFLTVIAVMLQFMRADMFEGGGISFGSCGGGGGGFTGCGAGGGCGGGGCGGGCGGCGG